MTPLTPAGQALPSRPVIVIHLEDPPGSALAACCGKPLPDVRDDEYRTTPRTLCVGCSLAETRRDIERQAADRALAELRRKVEGLFGQVHPMCAVEDEPTDHKAVSRKAVLALIDKASKPEEETP